MYKDKLQELREERNLKLRDIDKMLNIKLDTFRIYESERTLIPLKYLNKVCNFYEVSLDYIFGFNREKKYKNYNKEINIALSSKRLKELIKDKNTTQEKLSDVLKITQQAISNYCHGKSTIATPYLYAICSKYNISADYLLGKIDSPKYLNSTKK